MAINSIPRNSTIVLQLNGGTRQDGSVITVRRVINNVKTTATDQDVYDVAVAIASLQSLPVLTVIRTNDEELVAM